MELLGLLTQWLDLAAAFLGAVLAAWGLRHRRVWLGLGRSQLEWARLQWLRAAAEIVGRTRTDPRVQPMILIEWGRARGYLFEAQEADLALQASRIRPIMEKSGSPVAGP
jgi:hypothetical protein